VTLATEAAPVHKAVIARVKRHALDIDVWVVVIGIWFIACAVTARMRSR
jgi:hypothetical protein